MGSFVLFLLSIVLVAGILWCSLWKTPNASRNGRSFEPPQSEKFPYPPIHFSPKPWDDLKHVRYPVGIDTLAYWADGRFSVISLPVYDDPAVQYIGRFIDQSLRNPLTQSVKIYAFRYEKGVVVGVGPTGYLVANISEGNYEAFSSLAQVPSDAREKCRCLSNPSDKDNVYIVSPEIVRQRILNPPGRGDTQQSHDPDGRSEAP
jgi:hypothetical protein